MRAVLRMLLCGTAYGACFAPLALRGLAWVVLAPAFVVILPAPPWRAAALGAVLGAAGACATVAWLPRTVVTYFGQPWWIGAALLTAIVAEMVVPCYAAAAACAARFARRWRTALPSAVGAAWVAAEFARAQLLGGNPWVLFGYTQVGVPPVAQIADLADVYGLSFVLVASNVAAAELWLHGRGARGAAAVLDPASAGLRWFMAQPSLQSVPNRCSIGGSQRLEILHCLGGQDVTWRILARLWPDFRGAATEPRRPTG
ncbi:MAG: hypothetical protein SF182_25020 [Deltaproteobacteria bacterium]|nr:hypothetical protein [Deltaproteobacteria bacterium]